MGFHFFKPSLKLIERAQRLTSMMHHAWLSLFFFLLFFAESFVMVIPADTLISVTANLVPGKKKQWFFFSMLGYLVGFAIIVLLITTSFKHEVINLFKNYGFMDHIDLLRQRFKHYGYAGLGMAILVGVPPILCMTACLLVKLNPWVVFFVTLAAKIVRVWLLIFLVSKLWSAVILVKHKIEERGEEEKKGSKVKGQGKTRNHV